MSRQRTTQDDVIEQPEPMAVEPEPVAAVVAKPEPVAAAPEVQPTVEPELLVSARQFVRIRKFRWERSFGFLSHMQQHYPGNRTRTEWERLHNEFWDTVAK